MLLYFGLVLDFNTSAQYVQIVAYMSTFFYLRFFEK